MAKRFVDPLVVGPGKRVRTLRRLPRVHSQFDESFLQELLFEYPQLLPVNLLREDAGSLLAIGREVPVASEYIDNLYLSTAGYPVVVETKLWRNPQARREVLSQLLEYIKDLSERDFDWLEEVWRQFAQKRHETSPNLITQLSALADDPLDEATFVDRVNRALSRGDIIGIIVGDGIETRLQSLVDHLTRETPQLRYSLALVELACYELSSGVQAELLIVPRLLQNVEPVQRAYVRIDVAPSLEKQLRISSVVLQETTEKARRITLDEESFLNSVEKSLGRECRQQLEAFYRDLAGSLNLDLDFKSAALMLKVPHPDEEGEGASVLGIEKSGRLYNTKHLFRQLMRWRLPTETVSRITHQYWGKLHQLDPRFSPEGLEHSQSNQFVPFSDLLDKLPALKSCVEGVVAKIRETYSNLEQDS